jgi:hypothetical protein
MATWSKSLQGSEATLTLDSNSPTVIVQNINPLRTFRFPDALPMANLWLRYAVATARRLRQGTPFIYQISGRSAKSRLPFAGKRTPHYFSRLR